MAQVSTVEHLLLSAVVHSGAHINWVQALTVCTYFWMQVLAVMLLLAGF
jgi:hypothetical protein